MSSNSARPWLDSYAEGVPDDIDVSDGSLVDMVFDAVRRFGHEVALEFFGATTSYSELGDQIGRAAEGLRRLGVKKGDRVALILPNCPQHVVAFYAALRLGALVVEHNPLYTPRELRHQFEDHGAQTVIAWDKVCPTVQDLPDDLKIQTLISVDLTRAMPLSKRLALRLPVPQARRAREALTRRAQGTIPWEKLLENRPIRKRHGKWPTSGDVAALQYTSGTTGKPKGAMLSHRNLLANAAQGRAWVPEITDGTEVVYAVLPMFHAYGMTLCLTFAMSIGARLVLFPKFDADMVLDAARKHPPTVFPAVPPIYNLVATGARERGIDLRGVKLALSGAMELPEPIAELWEEITGGLLIEGYGLTEASPIAIGNPASPARRHGTVGVPFPSTLVRVVDPDDTAVDRAPGEEGELLIKGPQVFLGYWNNTEATRATLLADGWLRTGDIVTMSADGFVTIVDRIKELIITGGFNVAPSEVEDVLRHAPGVSDVAVVGLPADTGGEHVVAAVVLEKGATLDQERIRSFSRKELAAYKVPRTVIQVDDLPRSMIGKVLRREVRQRLLDSR
ncbi:MAG: long-chain-fatty-acid--CoA ligase [Microbacteriaceae bacterium]